jgi:hypothetical protein
MSKNEISTRERLPAGTQCIDPEWLDAAILGYCFAGDGSISVVYSAEACIDLIKNNLGLDTEQASGELAAVSQTFSGAAPIFTWGLD